MQKDSRKRVVIRYKHERRRGCKYKKVNVFVVGCPPQKTAKNLKERI
nr:MAG TPA: hypothetical protein [Caudoviricetes sp.]